MVEIEGIPLAEQMGRPEREETVRLLYRIYLRLRKRHRKHCRQVDEGFGVKYSEDEHVRAIAEAIRDDQDAISHYLDIISIRKGIYRRFRYTFINRWMVK